MKMAIIGGASGIVLSSGGIHVTNWQAWAIWLLICAAYAVGVRE